MKRRAAILFCLLGAGCGSTRTATGPGVAAVVLPKAKPEAAAQFDEGVRLLGQGPRSYEPARAAFTRATDLDSKLYEAWHNVGLIDARLLRWDQAVTGLQKALALQPASRKTALALGEALGRTGRHDEAEALFARWTKAHPDDQDLALLHVQALRDGGKTTQALEAARSLLAQDSKNARAFAAMGLVYLKLEKFGLAESALRRATELDPQSAFAFNNLGLVLLAQIRDQEAFVAFEKASSLDPKFAPARLNKASVYLDCGDYVRALAELEKAARVAPDDAEVQVVLGVAARGGKKFDRAREAYERALTLRPEYPAALFNLGILYMDHLADKKKAREHLLLYRKVVPDRDAGAKTKKAEALSRLKELG